MIDLHCHVLCGIDDGPDTLDGSVALARAAYAAGIETLVATPHVSSHWPNSARVIGEGLSVLQARLAEERVPVAVRPGGEIDVVRAADLTEEELRALRLGGGEWLLVECPLRQSAADAFELIVRALQSRGHRVVLAHPERSPLMRRRPRLLASLVEDGMLSSITAGSLAGRFGTEIREVAIGLLEAGLAHNVTSDAHNAMQRPPGLRDEILGVADELPGIEEQLDWLTLDVPAAVLGGGGIPARPGGRLQRRRKRRWALQRR